MWEPSPDKVGEIEYSCRPVERVVLFLINVYYPTPPRAGCSFFFQGVEISVVWGLDKFVLVSSRYVWFIGFRCLLLVVWRFGPHSLLQITRRLIAQLLRTGGTTAGERVNNSGVGLIFSISRIMRPTGLAGWFAIGFYCRVDGVHEVVCHWGLEECPSSVRNRDASRTGTRRFA